MDRQGPLGALIDRPAPPVTVAKGGPTGVLIGGPVMPDLPDRAVDRVVADGLREWLTFEERRTLALASERAAIATTGEAVSWRAKDGSGAVTADGTALPVDDVFRSLRGQICRNVRQSLDKKGEHAATVTLCRDEVAAGVTLWVIGSAD